MVVEDRKLPAEPPPGTTWRRSVRFGAALAEFWRYREVVAIMAERQFRAKYKQALLGAGWALMTPFILMLVLTFFRRVTNLEAEGVPGALFSYVGVIPWTFFTSAVSQGGTSLVANNELLNKVYCPREVFPLSMILVAAIDSAMALSILAVMFPVLRFAPAVTTYWVPVLLLMQLVFTAGVTLVVSAVTVYVRDLRHGLPLILQFGLFATPVAFSIDAIPVAYRTLYAAVNPLAPVIEGYRRTVLLGQAPQWDLLLAALPMTVAVLAGGYWFFKRLEWGFADVA